MLDTTTESKNTKLRIKISKPKIPIPLVKIEFTCAACLDKASIEVCWPEHHGLPNGWRSRDCVGSLKLPRRVDHIFVCPNKKCQTKLDELFPMPKKPSWFKFS